MDSLRGLRWLGVGALACIVATLLWLKVREAAPAAPATDVAVERALALEAERAVREGPAGAPAPLSSSGLQAIAERWATPAPPRPADRYRPRVIERAGSDRTIPAPIPGARAMRSTVARRRPEQDGDPRIRFAPSVRDLPVAPAP